MKARGVHGREGARQSGGRAAETRHPRHDLMAVGDPDKRIPIDDEVDGPADADDDAMFRGQLPPGLQGVFGGMAAVDALGGRLVPAEGQDLGGVAPHDVRPDLGNESPGRLRPHPRGPGADGIEDDRDAPFPGFPAGLEHGLDPGGAQGPDIDDQGVRDADHLLDFLDGVGHDRRGADGQEGVGRDVHGHEVGDVVNERGFRPDPFQVLFDAEASAWS